MSNVVKRPTLVQRGVLATLVLLIGVLAGDPATAQSHGKEKQTMVQVRTNLGTMVLALYNETPLHRDNFLKLVRDHAYDSLLFHRVVPGLIVQGGDPASKQAGPGAILGTGGPGYTTPAEIMPGLVHVKGALAAARQDDDQNPERRSNGSQFYVVQGKVFQRKELDMIATRNADRGLAMTYTEEQKQRYATEGGAPHLDGGYTVFGEVVEGLEVIDAITALPCDGYDRPLSEVRMFMRVLE